MLKDESKLWEFLNRYCILKFSFHIQDEQVKMDRSAKFIDGKFVENKDPSIIEKGAINFSLEGPPNHLIFSKFYTIFNTNINRVIALYPEIIKISKSEDFFRMKNIFIFQTMHILLITALEVYLSSLFLWVSRERILISDLNPKIFVKFLKTFSLRYQFLDIFAKRGNLNFPLGDILPERNDASVFQQKKKCKIAYNLIGIDVVNIAESIWDKIYSKNGYIKKRNLFIHSDIHNYIAINNIRDFDLDKQFEDLENALMDIVKFVYYIEHQRFFRYPDPAETSTGQLDNFNYGGMDPIIKRVLVNNNLDNFLYFAEHCLNDGNYEKAAEVFRVITEIQPNHVEVWYNLGLALENKNDLENSRKSYKKAYDIEPNYKDLKVRLSGK